MAPKRGISNSDSKVKSKSNSEKYRVKRVKRDKDSINIVITRNKEDKAAQIRERSPLRERSSSESSSSSNYSTSFESSRSKRSSSSSSSSDQEPMFNKLISKPQEPVIPQPPVIKLNINQDITNKPTDKITGTPTDNIVIEVFKVNGIPFDGILSDYDIVDIWKCLGRSESELDKTASEQVRKSCLRITYILKQPIQLTELSRKPEFSFDKKGNTKTDVYRARLCGYSELAYNLGETVTLTIQSTFFRVSVEHMMAWISPFGDVKSQPR